MSKKLRNLALLGGLGAAAMMMGRKKDDSKESKEDMERDAREEAISGPLKETKSDKASKAAGRALMKGDKADKSAADTTPSVRKPPADSGSVRIPDRGAEMTGKERANEMRRIQNRAEAAGQPRSDRLGESAFGRMIQGMRNRGSSEDAERPEESVAIFGAKKGGMVKSSASRRADGCAIRGKTKGRMV
jgi:hypothetical protein